jgi:hypothetical protein
MLAVYSLCQSEVAMPLYLPLCPEGVRPLNLVEAADPRCAFGTSRIPIAPVAPATNTRIAWSSLVAKNEARNGPLIPDRCTRSTVGRERVRIKA